jgi:hypothetical protein
MSLIKTRACSLASRYFTFFVLFYLAAFAFTCVLLPDMCDSPLIRAGR